jgi:YYY domain-containing protein
VLVGPDERVAFGPTAGAALRLLEQRGTLTRVYAQDDVSLFRYPLVDGTPPVVARDLTLRLPSLKTGMLDRPLAELPVVDEYGWNRLANQNWIVAIVLWLVVIQLLGLLALPLSVRIFNRSLGGGWAWSRLVGLIVWCYLIWLPVSLGWWTYQWPSLVIAAFGLVGLSWVVARGHSWRRSALDVAWRDILRFELLFLGSFLLWTLVRAANPDLWHPTLGGEKPFEFGMLNAIVRSPIMPPPDPFFSGGIINYYYYGLFIVSAPIRATGIDPASAFNLIVPLLFALTLTGATAFVRDLTGRWRWGLLAALLVCVLGPVASAFRFGESRGIQPAIDALRPGIAGWGGRLGDWFWGPSRIIPHTINEFPFFSYLFADLHPHMIALPITIMAAAIALQLLRGGYRPWASGGGWAPFCMAALVLGTLAVSNSWDAPTYALVLGGALVGSAWRSSSRTNGYATRAGRVVVASLLAVVLVAAGLLLYLPFFLQFQAMVGGIGQVRRQDSLLQFFAIHGTSLYITLTLLAGIGWVVLQRAVHGLSRPRWRRGVVVLPLLVMAMLLGAWAFAASPAALQADGGAGGSLLRPVLVVLVGMCVLLALAARLRDEEWITLWLISVALMVALGIQIIFVRDHLAGSDWERMNTVFKFGLQIWTLLALAAAAAFPLVLRLLRRAGEVFIGGWFTLLLVLVMAGAVYPLVATPSRVSLRFQNYPGLTLDGLAFMRTARYEHDGNPIELQWDAQAIDWMKENLRGLPVVLQSEAEFYRAYGVRIAANTGFPTVLGRLHQDEQRPAAPVLEREADVRALYSTPDPTTAVNLLAKYQVDYVYVGPAEQNFYDRAGLAKWDDLVGTTLELAYENPGVRLYRVSTDLQPQPFRNVGPSPVGSTASSSPPEPAVAPPPAVDETTLAGLEAAHQARPADGPTAFGLAMMYIQAGRLADAAAVLSSAAPSNRNDIPLHHLLGDIQAQLGRNDEAIDAWRTAADVDPSSGNLSKLGTGLTLLGRYDEAETVLRRALERDPNDMLVHFYLGELAARRGGPDDDDMARQAYTIYLEQAPADSPFRETARQALERLGQ